MQFIILLKKNEESKRTDINTDRHSKQTRHTERQTKQEGKVDSRQTGSLR